MKLDTCTNCDWLSSSHIHTLFDTNDVGTNIAKIVYAKNDLLQKH